MIRSPVADTNAESQRIAPMPIAPEKVQYKRKSKVQLSNLERSLANQRRPAVIAMALIAVAILFVRRGNYDGRWVMGGESLVVGLCMLGSWILHRSLRNGTSGSRWQQNGIASLISLAVLTPWLMNVVAKAYRLGNDYEIVMLGSLLWGAVAASLFANTSRTLNLSVICSGFLTLFTVFISDSRVAIWLAYLWGAICLWWLVSNHWEQMEQRDAHEIQHSSLSRGMIVAVGAVAFFLGLWAVGDRVPVLRKLKAELMPTSGGTSADSSNATRGVGNGDALVAAKSQPSTFGAVETDMFLDSDQPSLFDLFTDEFGEVRKKDRVEQTQALNPQQIEEQSGKAADANRSSKGGDFSIERQTPRERPIPPDLHSDALMFWNGAPHSHLAVERFDHFDGATWTKRQTSESLLRDSQPKSIEVEDQCWFIPKSKSVQNSISPFIDAIPEAMKFTRYGEAFIPTREGLQMWSIKDINRADFFAYQQDDSLSMPNRQQVPQYTMIRFVHSRMDLQRIEDLIANCAPGISHRHSSTACSDEIAKLAHAYAGDHPRSWAQVQSVVHGLRENFQASREIEGSDSEVIASEVTDASAIQRFLQHQRGPSYLFATTAALMLEHLGYQTRLVTGFYTQPKNFLGAEQDIAILPNDAHVWLEIHSGHGYWIPLEPTPTYREPPYRASILYAMYKARFQTLYAGIAIVLTGICLFWIRIVLFEWGAWMATPLLRLLRDRQQIAWLSWLLDMRARLAGMPRKPGVLMRKHFYPYLEAISTNREDSSELARQLQSFFTASDQLCFGGGSSLPAGDRRTIRQLWRSLTVRRLQRISKQLQRTMTS